MRAADARPSTIGGRYELRETLGQGATAVVWQAWDTLLQRMVALKVLDPHHANADGLLRVLREARATSDVVSDHVVRVQGVSGADAEVPYIDMELCAEFTSGGARALARPMSDVRATSLREALRWVVHAARGVHAAHQQGVFHRDLKPENILVRPASRRAQVTDFGLGVELSVHGDEARSAEATVSIRRQRKVIAGTPRFMAPEAAHGLEPADPDVPEQRKVLVALDVYGLGAVLYALLTGRPPYGPRPGAASELHDVLEQVREHPPAPVRSWTNRFRGGFRVSRRLERIVQRAMHRDPARRYPTALHLAEDLEAILSHRPTTLERDRLGLRLVLGLRRNQGAVATLVSLVLIGVVLVSGAAIGRGLLDDARRAITDQREAQRATTEARSQQSQAEAARDAAVEQREEAKRSRDLAAASAGLRVLEAEQRAAAADAALTRAVASEKAAQASEAAASRRARELEAAQVTAERARRAAEEAQARLADRTEAAEADAARVAKQAARLTTQADAAAKRIGELEQALASEKSGRADADRENERVRKLLAAEAAARTAAEGRASELLAEVERMRADLAALED